MRAKHPGFEVGEMWAQTLVLLITGHDLEQLPSPFSQNLSDAHFPHL